MSASNSHARAFSPRTFGPQQESAVDDENDSQHQSPAARRGLGRFSFSSMKHRPSFVTRWRHGISEGPGSPTSERPPIPSMMQPTSEAYVTPLPILSMIVLSITMLGEFLSANVSTPFLLFMVKGFDESMDEAGVAFWTGILVSTFFMTQFLTSLLWATVAEKHGRRLVLMVSLLGSALTCLFFGTSTTLQQAVCFRLLQGIFAGAVGVARGSVAFITDTSNEGRAYAILGFCWGFGGVAGAIIGGSFESPATKWPDIFQKWSLFVSYPYLLPCGLAASITLIGSVLSCFLGPDGGPREGAITLPPDDFDKNAPIQEEDSVPPSPVLEESEPSGLARIRKSISQKFSRFVPHSTQLPTSLSQESSGLSPVPLSQQTINLDGPRTASQTSRANGSAYGYGANYRSRVSRVTSHATLNARRKSMNRSSFMRRTVSGSDLRDSRDHRDLNFAQRLLMANENAVTTIADLWVASAMNVDNEDPFETDSEEGSDDDGTHAVGARNHPENTSSPTGRGREARINHSNINAGSPAPETPQKSSSRNESFSIRPQSRSHLDSPRPTSPIQFPHRQSSITFSHTTSPRRHGPGVPSIFAHPGVKTPPAVLDAQEIRLSTSTEFGSSHHENLAPIAESRLASRGDMHADAESLNDKPVSLTSQLPIVVIVQYGLLALHSTTHDQVFMSYLVSDYQSGGLNLNAGHFAQLIALMCLAQIAYQFYLYPNIGPPRGRFSHLSMFRIGSFLFIPAYLTVILYRPFANAEDDGNLIVMAALALSTALRYCGITFAYTAISILLNYMTPPNAVGYANGVAQSIVSLARFVGPVLGGYLWSASIKDGPSGYYFGFVVCAGVCALTISQSFLIR